LQLQLFLECGGPLRVDSVRLSFFQHFSLLAKR
jgi:hypothetical protein